MPEKTTAATDTQTAEHKSLKEKLAGLFRSTGHVAEHGVEDLAEAAASIALAGKFGE
jgi:hypothetical protein